MSRAQLNRLNCPHWTGPELRSGSDRPTGILKVVKTKFPCLFERVQSWMGLPKAGVLTLASLRQG